jgi:hypothetical protein
MTDIYNGFCYNKGFLTDVYHLKWERMCGLTGSVQGL